jgi:hypothetical protein
MPSPDLVTLFVAPLNRLEVTYMVTGALAAGMYGEARLTNDVDLVLALTEGDALRLHAEFDDSAFYVPPIEVIEIERRRSLYGHFNLIHYDTAFRADVYLAGEDPLHAWAFARRERVVVGGEPIWVAPPEYVILRKLQYLRDGASDKHVQDIRAMLRTLAGRIDHDTLLATAQRLGLHAEWERIV